MKCSDVCRITPDGPVCACQTVGYTLQDNRTCIGKFTVRKQQTRERCLPNNSLLQISTSARFMGYAINDV